MKKYLFIINPVSGKGRGRKLLPLIESFLKEKNILFDILVTDAPGHTTEIAKNDNSLYDVIISVGGDGTVNELINGIEPGSDILLGVLPIGSGNDFSLNLAFTTDLLPSLDLLIKSENYKLCDVCELEYKNGSEAPVKKRFVNNFGLGFDAQVAFINQYKKIGKGITSYIIAVLRALLNYQAVDYTLSFEDNLIEGKKLLLTFGNGISSGGGFYLTPNAVIDDQLMDITTIDFIGRFKLLKKLPMALANKLETVSEARMFKAEKAEIKLKEKVYIHTDGEAAFIETDKISVRVLDKKLKFISGI